MRRRARGFTLMEILIAMALTTIVTASVLAIVRTQLQTFEMQDQLVRTQQNTRAGMDFVENIVRRACAGISSGWLYVYTPGLVSTTGMYPCLQVYDGATVSGNTFTSTAPTSSPDALDVVYATGTMTALTNHANLFSTAPQIDVLDTCGFSANDYVLLTDKDYGNPALFHVSAVPTAATCPNPGTLSLDTISTAPSASTMPTVTDYVANTSSGTPVFKAATYSFYVSTDSNYNGMLMVDPDGIASTNHQDYTTKALPVQPAIEGVVDFQIAVGNDLDGSGNITDSPDEWIGNVTGETIPVPSLAAPWNSSNAGAIPQLRQVRISLLLRTLNEYAGTPGQITPFEDRTSYPPSVVGNAAARYRSVRMVVAPRAWNLTE